MKPHGKACMLDREGAGSTTVPTTPLFTKGDSTHPCVISTIRYGVTQHRAYTLIKYFGTTRMFINEAQTDTHAKTFFTGTINSYNRTMGHAPPPPVFIHGVQCSPWLQQAVRHIQPTGRRTQRSKNVIMKRAQKYWFIKY